MRHILRSQSFCTRLIAAGAILSTLSTAQQVLIVDAAGSPGSFATIAQAVLASTPGDTVLIKPGEYDGARISHALELIADGNVALRSTLDIEQIPAGATVRVRGLGQLASAAVLGEHLVASGCAGTVWIDDCDFSGPGFFQLPSVRADACAALVVSRSRLGSTSFVVGAAAAGLALSGSTAFLFESEVTGADGRSQFPTAERGAPGILAVDSILFVQDSIVRGGDGARVTQAIVSGDGGPGIELVGASTRVTHRGATFLGGAPGAILIAGATPGLAGPPTNILGGTFASLSALPLTMTAPSFAREGAPVDYRLNGTPGSAVALGFSIAASPLYFPPLELPLALGASFLAIPVGVIPTTGPLTLPTIVPDLGAGIDTLTYYVQAIAIDPSGILLGGTAQGITMVDAAF